MEENQTATNFYKHSKPADNKCQMNQIQNLFPSRIIKQIRSSS